MNEPTSATFNSKSDERFSANCPACVDLRSNGGQDKVRIPGSIVNLSVSGCLFTSDHLPWSSIQPGQSPMSATEIVGQPCRVQVPWANLNCIGTVRRVGSFIIGIQFQEKLHIEVVRIVSRLEPGKRRSAAATPVR